MATAPTKTTAVKTATSAPKTATFGSSGQYTYKVDSKGTPYGNPINTTPATPAATTSAQNTSMAAFQKANPNVKVSATDFNPTTGALNPNIQTQILKDTIKADIPTPPVPDLSSYQSILNAFNAKTITPEQYQQSITDLSTKNQQTSLDKMLAQMVAPPSTADAYLQAQRETDIVAKTQRKNELAAQLGQITAQGQALQQQVVGQGRGIPEAIIGGQQAQIARETAIQALPISAQLAAAQEDYATAKEDLNTLFKLKSEDATNKYNYQKEVAKIMYDFATEKEKSQLELSMKQLDKKVADEQKLADFKTEATTTALKNGAPSSIINQITKATDKAGVLSIAGKYLVDPLDIQLKNAQIAKAWADAKKVDTTSGVLTEPQIKQIDNSPQGKKLTTLSGLYQKSQTYKKLVDTYGFKAAGNEKALIDSAYADLKIAYKEAANLGALTGPDVGLIEEAIKPASGATNYLNYRLSGGTAGVSGAIDQALNKAKTEALLNYKQLTKRNPNYAGSEYVKSLISPFSKDYNTVDLVTVPKGEIIETEDGILLEALGNGEFSPL